MAQITIVYYSETGNTEAMASMVAKGVEAAGATAKVVSVDGFDAAELKDEAAFALGCPAMGDEVLEEGTMEPFVEEVAKFAAGKKNRTLRFLWMGRRRVDAQLGKTDAGCRC